MKLEVGHIFINDIQFASESKIENGVLYVDEEAVKAIVLEDEKIKDFIQELQYRGITLVDIETFSCENVIFDEKKLVVDQDMCVVSM